MEFWKISPEYKKIIDEDRARLLAINDFDALSLSVPDRYMRNKYKGEIESQKWLDDLQRQMRLEKSFEKKYDGKPKNEKGKYDEDKNESR